MGQLQGKIALVTGGTRGIGLAIVKAFIEEGASVALCGSRPETAEKALAELKAAYPTADLMALSPDLALHSEVEEAVAAVKAHYGRIDILVNNAGVSARESLYNYETEAFDRVMDLNVNAIFYTSRAVAPIMKEQGGGVILNTSSMVSLYGQPAGCAYPASKFAVNGLTKSLARELGRDNIRVNAILPGVTRTDMVAALPKEMVERISAPIPLGRVGEPE
ncbi:MAG: SDR family oxidoreductase, partial [Clostridia bacterium]|nr:SDR family oxidoreductase [Clostridia bacterium]